MTEEWFSIKLPTDENGKLPRQCPKCDGKFSIHGEDYESSRYLNLRCPYCEWTGGFDEFLTEEQAEYALSVSRDETVQMIGEEVGKAIEDIFGSSTSSGNIDISMESGDFNLGKVGTPSPHLSIATKEISCNSCGFRYEIREETQDHLCPVCR